jgi:type I restriction enzyme, S subunit
LTKLPPGWAFATGSDVFDFVTSGSRGWAQYYSDDGAIFVRIGNLNHGTIALDLREIQYVRPPLGTEGERTRLQGNDILVSITAELGMVGLVAPTLGEAYINQHVALARPRSGCDPRYLAWYLASEADGKRQLLEMRRGATKAGLGLDDIRNVAIPLPPLAEQKRIADKLDAVLVRVDACRERLDRIPAILKRFRQSVLAAATSGELTRGWREERGLRRAWRETTLGALVSDIRYGTSKKCAREPRKTPVLRIPNVVDGAINHDDLKYADFGEAERAKLALEAGDILMIRSNGSLGLVGRTALVSARESGFLYAGYLIRLRADSAQVRPAYLSLFLASPASRVRIELAARSTTGVNNINAEEIRGIPVVVPGLDEQAEIIRRVGELLEIAARLEQRLVDAQVHLSRTTPSVLAKAFRGELVPRDPNDEPASALLERIRGRTPYTGTGVTERRGASLRIDRPSFRQVQ